MIVAISLIAGLNHFTQSTN